MHASTLFSLYETYTCTFSECISSPQYTYLLLFSFRADDWVIDREELKIMDLGNLIMVSKILDTSYVCFPATIFSEMKYLASSMDPSYGPARRGDDVNWKHDNK
jgi:hypothetical protein